MNAKYIQRGESLDYTNGGAAKINAGTVVSLTTRIGVAGTDIPVGKVGTVHVEGVFELPKASAVVVALGAAVYYDVADDNVNVTATDNIPAGYAVAAAGAGTTTVLVKLLG